MEVAYTSHENAVTRTSSTFILTVIIQDALKSDSKMLSMYPHSTHSQSQTGPTKLSGFNSQRHSLPKSGTAGCNGARSQLHHVTSQM